jgi:hypothetical protein
MIIDNITDSSTCDLIKEILQYYDTPEKFEISNRENLLDRFYECEKKDNNGVSIIVYKMVAEMLISKVSEVYEKDKSKSFLLLQDAEKIYQHMLEPKVFQKDIIEYARIRKRLGDIYYHEGLCFQTEGDKWISEQLEKTIAEYTIAKEIFKRDDMYKLENAIVTNNLGVTITMMQVKCGSSHVNCHKDEANCLFDDSLELLGWSRRYSPEYKVIEYNRRYAKMT